MKSKSIFILFAAFAVGMLFFQIGAAPLLEPDEGRYANISQEMLESGDWLVPHKNGFIHFHKPPMTYWTMALSQKVFGTNEWGVRFPNALFGLGIVLLVIGIARRLWDDAAALLSALILLAIPLFVFMARLATTDIGLVFWVTLAVYCFISYQKGRSGLFLLGTYCALGVSMLTKGPVGLVLFAIPAASFFVLLRERKGFSFPLHLLGLVLFGVLSLSWYIWAIKNYPGLLDYFLFFQTAERMAGKSHHTQDWFYFLPVLIGTFFPWSLYIPAAVREIVKNPKGSRSRLLIFWTALWTALIFIFFSALPSKLASYLLPLSVPLCLWCAVYFSEKIFDRELKDRFFYATSYFTGFVFWIGGLGLGIYTKFFLHERIAGFEIMFFIGAFLLPLAGLVILFFSQKRRPFLIFATMLVAMYLTGLTVWNSGLPRVGTYKTVKPFAHKIMELREAGEPVIAYRKLFSGLPFYLNERVIVIATKTEFKFDTEEETKGYLYKDAKAVKNFINSSKRCFILTKTSDARELQELYGGKLKEIMRDKKVVLYTNKSMNSQ